MGEERYVREELSKAREALRDAQRLLESGGTDEGVVNRMYYASFHAAQAALYDRGVAPSSHGAVRNLFGEHIVLPGDANREMGRLLTTLGDLRQQADYGYEPLEVDVEALLDRTRSFVEAIDEIVEG